MGQRAVARSAFGFLILPACTSAQTSIQKTRKHHEFAVQADCRITAGSSVGQRLRATSLGSTSKGAGNSDRHQRPGVVAAFANTHHHGRRDRPAGGRDRQRHRQRRCAEVLPQPAGAQALCRRLQPCGAVQPRLGHRQQRAFGCLRGWHPAVELPGQWRDLRAALGTGHAGGDRTGRCDVRPVLGSLSRQFGRRRGRLRDAHAQAV